MAQKKKTSSRSKTSSDDTTKVTRITAKDTRVSAEKKSTPKKTKDETKEAVVVATKKRTNPLRALGGYFKGAWQELRQVRWPNRRTTWGLTLAVILFTIFFIVLIVLLDYTFQWVFDQILG